MAEQSGPSIDAHGYAAVRRGAEIEGFQDAAETLVHLFERVALQREAPFQQLALVDPDRATAEFPAIQRDVVLHRPGLARRIRMGRLVRVTRCSYEQLLVFGHHAAERVVGRVPAPQIGLPLVHGKVHDPAIGQHVLVGQAESEAQLLAQPAQNLRHQFVVRVGDDQDEVARLRGGGLDDGRDPLVAQELGNG